MKGLLRLLSEHEGPLTADFQREYGLRLADVVRQRTPGEIENMILWLPRESAFRASFLAKTEDEAVRSWSWSDEKELLLTVINVLITQTHVVQQVNSQKRLKAPSLIDSPRTGGQKPAKHADADSFARGLIAAARARKGT